MKAASVTFVPGDTLRLPLCGVGRASFPDRRSGTHRLQELRILYVRFSGRHAVEMDTAGPAVEFNWGALPNVHLHIIVPLAAVFPSNNPSFAPSGTGPNAVGLGDIETGVKFRFIQETKHRPQVGTFVMFELPSGKCRQGPGSGQDVVQSAPVGAEEFGAVDHVWRRRRNGFQPRGRLSQLSVCGLAGAARHRQEADAGHGGLLSRAGRFGDAADEIGPLLDVGGYYKFRDPGFQLLFAYGHTVAGQSENYAYLGLYWTWGKQSDKQTKTRR